MPKRVGNFKIAVQLINCSHVDVLLTQLQIARSFCNFCSLFNEMYTMAVHLYIVLVAWSFQVNGLILKY